MTTDPMKRYFDELRQEIKELKDRRSALDQNLHELEQLEAFLVEQHANPSVLLMVQREQKRVPVEEDEEETPEPEQNQAGHLIPIAAVRQMFQQPGTTLTSRQVQESLEHMRQQGLIETTVATLDAERANKILRTLRDQGFLKRVEGEERGTNKSYIRV